MIRLRRRPVRDVPLHELFGEPVPPDLADHTSHGGRRFDLHDLRCAALDAPDDRGWTFLARANGVDGWIRCDIPHPVGTDWRSVAVQKGGPLHATAGDVEVRIDWTRPSSLDTLRRLEWVRTDDPTPRRLSGVLGQTTKVTAGNRTIMKDSLLRMRVADDIDAVDLAMVLLTARLN